MKILIEGDDVSHYLAKVHEAFRSGLRREFGARAFGVGYPGFDPAITSFRELVDRYYPAGDLDLLIPFFEMVLAEPRRFRFDDLNQLDCPKGIFVGDSWYITDTYKQQFIEIVEQAGIDYIFSYFPMMIPEYAGTALESKIIFTPPCIDTEIFKDWGCEKRFDVGFLAAGTTKYDGFYPERYAIHQQLLRLPQLKYLWAEHPGWGDHRAGHPLVGDNFSKAINSCRIFITTAGKHRHPNPKYFEILGSRSCLFAQKPLAAEMLELSDGVNYVEIDERNILEKLEYYLKRPDLVQQIADAGYEIVRQYHSCEARAHDIVRAVNEHQQLFPRARKPKPTKGEIPPELPTERIEIATDYQREAKAMKLNELLEIPEELLIDDNHPQQITMPPKMKELILSSSPQYTLYRLIRYLKPKRILEIGTQLGSSAVAMALAQRDNGMTVDVTCIDPFLPCGDNDGIETLSCWHKQIHESGYLAQGIELAMTTSDKFLPHNSKKYDFVVIDGSHEYKDVKYDFQNVLPHVELGGVIWLHDYMIYESVRQAINETIIEKQLPFSINEIQRNSRGDLCGWAIVRNWPYRHLRWRNDIEIKLNLGCGNNYREGYLNLDSDSKVRADVHADMLALPQLFAPQSVSEVYLNNSLVRLPLVQARELMRQIRVVLRAGGRLVIETPNLERAMEKIIGAAGDFDEYLEGIRPFHAASVDQWERRTDYRPHAFSWSPAHLQAELEEAGFENVVAVSSPKDGAWCNFTIEARAPEKKTSLAGVLSSEGELNTIKGRVLMLFDSHLGHTSKYVRALVHRDLLAKNGWDAEFVDYRELSEQQIVERAKNADLVYMVKVASIELLRKIKRETAAKVIFELADALWQPIHRQSGWQNLEQILQEVDLVAAENQYIAAYAVKYNQWCHVPVATHPERFDEARARNRKVPSNKVVVGWVGSTGTVSAMSSIAAQLRTLCERNPQVELRIVGCDEAARLAPLQGLPLTVVERYDEAKMFDEIVSFDIGLFPPPFDEEDYIARGAQKAMLYLQGGVPVVAWRAGEVCEVVEDGVTGYLVDPGSSWVEKIEQLIHHPELRKSMGEVGSQRIREEHSNSAVFKKLEYAFEVALNTPRRADNTPATATRRV